MVARLDLDTVDIRDGRVQPATLEEVDALEAALGLAMPAGYREYVTQLGYGDLASLRVLTPDMVLERLGAHRGAMAGYWRWGSPDVVFGQDQAVESVCIADTDDGDVMVLSSSLPDRIVILPRHAESVIVLDADVLALVEWLCGGGLGHRRTKRRIFRPEERSRHGDVPLPPRAQGGVDPPTPTRPPEDTLLAYLRDLEAAERWYIDRHGGPAAFRRRSLASPPAADTDRFWQECQGIYDRSCTPTLASVLGNGIAITGFPPHGDPEILSIAPPRRGRVRIDVVHGWDHGPVPERHVYTLEAIDGEWRIDAVRTEPDDTLPGRPPRPPYGLDRIRSRFRR